MDGQVQVHIRAKPCAAGSIWSIEESALEYQRGGKITAFTCFKSVYSSEGTAQIYQEQVRPAIDAFVGEENVTVIAYGQTGSGKTYTMTGGDANGLIHLALRDILPRTVTMSCMEIYNERIYDLRTTRELNVYTKDQRTLVAGLHMEEVRDEAQALEFLRICEANRRTSTTEYNLKSSRSHTIIQVRNNKAILNFVDLAGCEKASTKEARRKEGAYINRSLLALGKLVNNLTVKQYMGFRESKLTRILQHSFSSKTHFIAFCMISSEEDCLEESLSTLQFAARLCNLDLKGVETVLSETDKNKMQPRLPFMVLKKEDKKRPEGVEEHGLHVQVQGCGAGDPAERSDRHYIIIEDEDKGPSHAAGLQKSSGEVQEISIIEKAYDDLFEDEGPKQDGIDFYADLSAVSPEAKAAVCIYEKRIASLENMIAELLEKNPNRLMSEIFILEKQMFNLRKQLIKKSRTSSF